MTRISSLYRIARRFSSLGSLSRTAAIPITRSINTNLSSLGLNSQISTHALHPVRHSSPWTTHFLRRLSSSLPADGTELLMPALSPTMDQGSISSWLKKEGDKIYPGDAIAEIETDKAVVQWELTDGGYMAKILYPAGSKDISVGTCVAILVDEEKDIAAYKDYKHEGSPAQPSTTESAPESAPVQQKTTLAKEYPPHNVVGFPALSPTMESGGLGNWVKKEGDYVNAGDTICSIVTDKATNDFECLEEGYIAKILVPDGAEGLAVGVPIVVLVEDKKSIPAFAEFKATDAEAPAAATSPPPTPVEPAPAAKPPPHPSPVKRTIAAPTSGRVIATPYAKKLASQSNLSLEGVAGSGPKGRIIAADVRDLIDSGGSIAQQPPIRAEGPYVDIPLTQIRRVIAQRLTESKQTIPHYYLTVDCVVDELIELRKTLNSKLEKQSNGTKLSVNDFVIKAAALALRDIPEVNSSWQGDFIRQYTAADISIAVQTTAGLMVPIVRNADAIGLQLISQEVKTLAEKAKTGSLKPEEFTGGTFTISNLGMFGIKQFCAIVNPPQAAILAVGAAQSQFFKDKKTNEIRERMVMSCTLSCDHRVVDGAVGATWLKEFKEYLEQPSMMLL